MPTARSNYPAGASAAARPSVALDLVALALLIVGGLNWGLVGLFDFDLVAFLFGQDSLLSRAVYVLVGIAAVYGIVTATKLAKLRGE